MIDHNKLSTTVFSQKRKLYSLIKKGEINLGGNRQLKIYGTLACNSGKRLKLENRVFFVSEKEAVSYGYRPCGHCLKSKYQSWKYGISNNK